MLESLRATLRITYVEKLHDIGPHWFFDKYYFTAEKANGEHLNFFTFHDLSRVGVGTPHCNHVEHPEDLDLISKLFREERKLMKEAIHHAKDNIKTILHATI